MTEDQKFLARHLPHFNLLVFFLAATLGVFSGGSWASFGIGGAIIIFASVWRIEGRAPLPDRCLIYFALTIILLAAALNVRSTQSALSWNMWIRITTVFLPLCLF